MLPNYQRGSGQATRKGEYVLDIKTKAYEILAELSGINIDDITDEDALIADLGLDSLGLVELLVETEDRFEIVLDESDMNPFDLTTVRDYIELVKKYVESGEQL